MVTGFIFLEECARYLYLLKVNVNIHDGGMNEGEAVHLSFSEWWPCVCAVLLSCFMDILHAGAVSDIRKGLSAADLVIKINFLIAILNIFFLMKPLSTLYLWS